MTLPGYRARIQIGSHVWTVDAGDPAAYGPALPLRSGWTMATGEPSYPGPITETVSIPLVCADHTIPDSITIGDPIEVLISPAGVTPDPAVPSTLIWGQWLMVADVSVSPHPLGLLVTVNGAGWLSTLSDRGSILESESGSSIGNRTFAAFNIAGQEWVSGDSDYIGAVGNDFLLAAEAPAWVTLADRANRYELLVRGAYTQPVVTRGLPGGPTGGWRPRTCMRPIVAQADLVLVGGIGAVVPRAATAANSVINAAYIPTDLEWSRTRDSTPTRWIASYVTAIPGTPPDPIFVDGPPAELVLDTTPTGVLPRVYQIDTGATDVIHAILPDMVPPAADLARAWVYEAAAAGEVPGLYRTTSLGIPLTSPAAVAALPQLWLNWLASRLVSAAPVLDRGIVVSNLATHMRPTGRSWFAGRCVGAEVTIAADPAESMGRVSVTIDLTPTLPIPPIATGHLIWSAVPAMTWAVTPVTWHDLRLT